MNYANILNERRIIMAEAILGRSAGSGSGGVKVKEIYKTEIITENTIWNVPKINKSKGVSVRIFGGGGGGYAHANNMSGGGGGNMNNAIFTNLSEGQSVIINIGDGGYGAVSGSSGGSGGTTTFGSLLSATGGNGGRDAIGGSGGSGGGVYSWKYYALSGWGGVGYQFGGGGASCRWANSFAKGGNGGKWGGGGGVSLQSPSSWKLSVLNEYRSYGGLINVLNLNEGFSGLAGNGGIESFIRAENGTNTIGMNLEFEGPGLSGDIETYNWGAGGGGYGGCGGNYGGGGGGYGANGGSSNGGGGGYGGHGGNGDGGGGGGYGLSGSGGDSDKNGGIAAGGGPAKYGGNGICVLQYYQVTLDY